MPTLPLRHFTGLEITPSSMAWLIRQRRELKCKLDAAKRDLAKCKRRLDQDRQDLADLEAELANLPLLPRRKVNSKPLVPGRGNMGAAVLTVLREAHPAPMSTMGVAERFARTIASERQDVDDFEMRHRVHSVLARLRKRGDVRSSTKSRKDGTFWSLPKEEEFDDV